MARISLEELYRGDDAGGRYNIMGKVVKELLINGVPPKYDEDTWREILLIKHTDSGRKNEKRGRLCVGVNRYKSRPFFMRRDNLKKIKNIFSSTDFGRIFSRSLLYFEKRRTKNGIYNK